MYRYIIHTKWDHKDWSDIKNRINITTLCLVRLITKNDVFDPLWYPFYLHFGASQVWSRMPAPHYGTIYMQAKIFKNCLTSWIRQLTFLFRTFCQGLQSSLSIKNVFIEAELCVQHGVCVLQWQGIIHMYDQYTHLKKICTSWMK
jgi:hypothetical protein